MICDIDFPDIHDANTEVRWRGCFAHPHRVLVAHTLDEVAGVIAQAEKFARDEHWVLGFVSYEAAPAFDRALQVKQRHATLPLAVFAIYGYDEPSIANAGEPDSFSCGSWSMNVARDRACADIESIRAAIANGDYYQINYTAQLEAAFAGSAEALYASLRKAQPDGYSIYIDCGDWQLASVSPELFFDWTPDRTLTTRPMKGTAPPGTNAAAMLHDSAKERAENLMIVDLLRNDLSRVAETGSVEVTRLFEIETLPTALQMTSTVRCKTRPETTLLDVFSALFPCGSVTGAPKIAAMEAIAALETAPRGAYCGALGMIRPNGHATFNVGIRTVTVDARRGIASCGVGSGITLDSNPAAEYAEWLVKRRFLLRAAAPFQLLETLRLEAGRYWLLEGHLERLRQSAEYFGFVYDSARVRAALDQVVASHASGQWRVRLLLARDGQPMVECLALESAPKQVQIALAASPVDSSDEFLRHKTTQRSIYAPHVPQTEAVFDVLLFNERDEITEFTRGNVVVELDGACVTPPLSSGLLPGVLRGELLRKGEAVERMITRVDLSRATRIWFANSVRGLIEASMVAS